MDLGDKDEFYFNANIFPSKFMNEILIRVGQSTGIYYGYIEDQIINNQTEEYTTNDPSIDQMLKKSFLSNDSKKLSEKKRKELRPIIEKEALSFAVGIVDNHEIDEINILNASMLISSGHSMLGSIDGLANLVIDAPWCKVFHHSTEK